MKSPFLEKDFESIRKKAYALRHNYFDDMDKHLLSLESSLAKKGLDVLWIKDKNSIFDAVESILKKTTPEG